MTDYNGKGQFFWAFQCSPEHEAEGDRVFAEHAAWMERTHPRDGELALLQYTVSKGRVHGDEEMVVFALWEVYETMAGVENHIRLAHDDEEDSGYVRLSAWARKCESIHGSTQVIHSLW